MSGRYKSEEIMQFLDSNGVRSHFSTPKEHGRMDQQRQSTRATINSIMMIARTVMIESGLRGRFWIRAATAGEDARYVIFKERVGMTPYQAMYGEQKDVLDYQAFGCRAWVYLDKPTPRERKAHAEGKGSRIYWIRSKDERVGILGP